MPHLMWPLATRPVLVSSSNETTFSNIETNSSLTYGNEIISYNETSLSQGNDVSFCVTTGKENSFSVTSGKEASSSGTASMTSGTETSLSLTSDKETGPSITGGKTSIKKSSGTKRNRTSGKKQNKDS